MRFGLALEDRSIEQQLFVVFDGLGDATGLLRRFAAGLENQCRSLGTRKLLQQTVALLFGADTLALRLQLVSLGGDGRGLSFGLVVGSRRPLDNGAVGPSNDHNRNLLCTHSIANSEAPMKVTMRRTIGNVPTSTKP